MKRAQPLKRPVRVCLLVFPECDPSILYGVYDTLWSAGHLWNTLRGLPAGESLFEPFIVGSQRGPLRLVTGVTIHLEHSMDDIADADCIFVPNVIVTNADSLRALDRRLLAWMRRMHEAGTHIYSACGGSLALAEAGLLDGLETTTHWGYASLFAREYPRVKLHADRILVQTGRDQRIVCCGGASSWQDLVLYLVARHAGAEEAVRLSKIFLYQWHREGQRPYTCLLQNVAHEDAVIRAQQAWLAENYRRPNLVAELVRRSRVPERSFARRFKAATGYTPIAYIQALRIEEAKQLLESGDLTVDAIGA